MKMLEDKSPSVEEAAPKYMKPNEQTNEIMCHESTRFDMAMLIPDQPHLADITPFPAPHSLDTSHQSFRPPIIA